MVGFPHTYSRPTDDGPVLDPIARVSICLQFMASSWQLPHKAHLQIPLPRYEHLIQGCQDQFLHGVNMLMEICTGCRLYYELRDVNLS
ncbi:hypothetical protein MLD38_019909 [Melastoma candidum]|uniref:Uncharacterized protein n=1 Tax=Melastoma candidum TaxID=119954 RepID=A0ACB9QBJ1_9MYRT|nr:hypothetical protein MLD38_019909 [Melastoma candidum]